MKFLSLYHIPIAYLILYTIVILISGVWMFLLSQGLNSSDIFIVLQKMIENPYEKSLHFFVEVATAHLFAIGIVIFIIAHFLLFSQKISYKFSKKLSLSLFILALFNILAFGSSLIKLILLALFLLVFLLILTMLLFSL
ncbi:hypothetical protein MNB_SV-13-10 [hydrothermal vent metagenome]|uniref:Uncharacterized protein n=1 Tax=hydrothermal vent metagenome TaxID=652676 RepID=A0A1W1CZG9_9ZZZZ